MPIIRRTEVSFPEQTRGIVTRAHRFAVLFGLVMPLLAWLAVGLATGDIWSIWPSQLTMMYEHAYYFGWAGIYMLGLISFLSPQLRDIETDSTEERRLAVAFWLYVGGTLLMLASHLSRVFIGPGLSHSALLIGGAIVQATGWLLAQYQEFVWHRGNAKQANLHAYVRMAGMVFFSSALLLNILADVLLLTRGIVSTPLMWLFTTRILPSIGLGLISMSFIVRMAPEMLGWRPLDDERLKHVYAILIVAALMVVVAQPYFQAQHDVASAVIYGLGSFLALLSIIWLLTSVDLFQIRLSPTINREHVWYVYGSIVWMLLSVGYFVVMTVWELSNRTLVAAQWSEAALHAFFAGFIAQGLLGIYTYVINHLTDANRHRDLLSTVSFVLINWVLLVRVFLFPFMITTGWLGAETFKWVLDVLLYAGLAGISIDMYFCLCNHRWRWPWGLKK